MLDNDTLGSIYLFRVDDWFKIGKGTPSSRYKQIRTMNPYKLEFVCSMFLYDHDRVEKELHETFKHRRGMGEWFLLDTDDLQAIFVLGINNIEFADEYLPIYKQAQEFVYGQGE